MKTFLPMLLGLVTAGFCARDSSAQKASPPQGLTADRHIIVDGRSVHYQTGGNGPVTVVFESGHWSDLGTWDDVYSGVARFARVLRYDREGYGSSETADEQPTSFRQIAIRLHDLLQKADVPPPYVLVGHSLGGALIRSFAFLYPKEVGGFVFVDPFEEYESQLSREGVRQWIAAADSGMAKQHAPATALAEWKVISHELLNGFPELNAYGAVPDVPTALLAAGKGSPPGIGKGDLEETEWAFFKNRIAPLSESRFIDLPQSPHSIQAYDSPTVIESIRRVVFPNPETVLRKTLGTRGVDSSLAQYRRLKASYPKEYMSERLLGDLGYEELKRGDARGAIKLFGFNSEMYPNSDKTYAGLGDAYAAAGNKAEAIRSYKRPLVLNRSNPYPAKKLEELTR